MKNVVLSIGVYKLVTAISIGQIKLWIPYYRHLNKIKNCCLKNFHFTRNNKSYSEVRS